ncbi:hypothetical protein CORC01_09518 [Colletotrichum orchidophilum]|uniref:Xylanolytic transcriptional activator regulatory domain-containing protein n=1 Tax=Colletotrichum orchidophilum TaxID=1209926 RepID=A0A1G4B171_9PEZI|nr:uncharacterized protein CORC01_09518 [Colletotrichum orchidophilum]OHE95131.1 hypothetical protein CORC01_09518 [Colletotrichum orchidophilum]
MEVDTTEAEKTQQNRSSNEDQPIVTLSLERGFRACIECRRRHATAHLWSLSENGRMLYISDKEESPGISEAAYEGEGREYDRPAEDWFDRPPFRDSWLILSSQLEYLVGLLESRLEETPKSQSSTCESPGRDTGSVQSSATSPSFSESTGTCREDASGQQISGIPNSTAAMPTGPGLASRTHEYVEAETVDSNQQPSTASTWTGIPDDVVTELVNLYFDKIQAWLPLLHRPNFFAQYLADGSFHSDRLQKVSLQEALLFFGIFALAARHSKHEYFKDMASPNRGERFAEQAIKYYAELRSADFETNLEYLQGCILLAFYLYTSGPSHQAWILTGVCVRLAYDLDLCCMDEDEDVNETAAEWSAAEERRRAFWLVWELDTFASILSMRPRGLNSQRIVVRLPASDQAWFSNHPCESPAIPPDPAQAWKVLLDSPNNDERAWFLLANHLMALAYEAASGRHKSQRDHSELTSSITYFSLAVSQRYGLETNPPAFVAGTFARDNWIIGMHLMLACTRACLSVLTVGPVAGIETFGDDFSRILNRWHPEYIALSHPFFAGTLLYARTYPSLSSTRPLSVSCNQELAALILSHFATFWKLGSLLLGLVTSKSSYDEQFRKTQCSMTKYCKIYFSHLSIQHESPGGRNPAQVEMRHSNMSSAREEIVQPQEACQSPGELFNIQFGLDEVASDAVQLPTDTLEGVYNWCSPTQMDYLCGDSRGFGCFE